MQQGPPSQKEIEFDLDKVQVDKFGIVQSPYYMIKVLLIDTSASMGDQDCIYEGQIISRLDAIKAQQLKTLQDDKLFLGWFIYKFDENFQPLFKTDFSVKRDQWMKQAQTAIQGLSANGGTKIDVAITSLNKEILSIIQDFNNLMLKEKDKRKRAKLWIFVLTDNEDTYQYENLEQNSRERDASLKKYDMQRFIRIWDQKVADKEKLKKALAFDPKKDEQFENAEQEVKNTYRIMKANSSVKQFEESRIKLQKEKEILLEKVKNMLKENDENIRIMQQKNKIEMESTNKRIEEIEAENMITSNVNPSQLSRIAIEEKYKQFKNNCLQSINNKKEVEHLTDEAYELLEKNSNMEADIEKLQQREIKLKNIMKDTQSQYNQWKVQDKSIILENIKDLEKQINILDNDNNKTNQDIIQKKNDLYQNSKQLMIQTLQNILKSYEKLLIFAEKFEEQIVKYNSKVNKSKQLTKEELQIQFESTKQLYDQEFNESQIFFSKLLESIDRNKKCFLTKSQSEIQKLLQISANCQSLRTQIGQKEKYELFVKNLGDLLNALNNLAKK